MATFQIKLGKYAFALEDVVVDVPKYPPHVVDEFKKKHVTWLNYDRLAAWPMELGLNKLHYETMLVVSYGSVKRAFGWNHKMPPSKVCAKIVEEGSFGVFEDIEPYFFIKETGNENRYVPIALLPFFVVQGERAAFTYSLFEWLRTQLFSDSMAKNKPTLDHMTRLMFFVFPIVYEETTIHLARISHFLPTVDTIGEDVRTLKRRLEAVEKDNKELKSKIQKIMN